MNVMVIGCESFVGQYLVDYLNSQSYNVISLESNEIIIPKDKWQEQHDCSDNMGLKKISDAINEHRPNWIFSLPAQFSVKSASNDPVATVDLNINSMLYLLDVVKQLDYKPNVLIVGSADEYGFVPYNKMPIKETEPTNPENIFAATKVCQEMLAQIYHRAYKLNVIIARVFNVIGPGQSDDFAIADFTKQVALMQQDKIDKVLHVGNLNVERDFIDVRDMVKALVALIQKGKFGEVYNVGTGSAIALKKIIEVIKNATDVEFNIAIDQSKLRHLDIAKLEADVSKIYKDTAWKSEIEIEETINDMLNFWLNSIS